MKNGDWIKIDFVGRVRVTGEVFDLTREDDAKAFGIHDKKKKYGPALVILGGGMIIVGVENELLGMDVGEKKKFTVKPEDALGQRKPALMRVLPVAKFTKEKITPFPGLWLMVDGMNCKVVSVAGGRVKVDFNHPLAGKELEYEVEIAGEVKDSLARVEELMELYGIGGKASVDGKKVTISTEKEVNGFAKRLLEDMLRKWGDGIESVAFEVKKPHEKKPAAEETPAAEEKKAEATA